MQLFGYFGVIALVGLVSLSGMQIVPESVSGRADASESGGLLVPPANPSLIPAATLPTTDPAPAADPEVAPVFVPAVVTNKEAQNIEATTALLRGQIAVGTETVGDVFFVYAYDDSDVDRSLAAHTTYEQVLANKRTEATVVRVARGLTDDQAIATRVSRLAPDTTYYVRLCAERTEQLSCSNRTDFKTIPNVYRPGEVRLPTIRINHETAQAADELILEMTIAMRDTVDGDVYLIYGQSAKQVEDAREQSYSRIDEDDEQLQVTRVIRGIRGTQRLIETVDDLEADEMVYYAVCVEYDGLQNGVVCTRTQSYQTYDEDYGASPRVSTEMVVVKGQIARLSGAVRMLDFNDGKVFFVYGSDLDRVTSVVRETSMERLRQTKDRFQRVLVDTDLDGNATYDQTIRDLLPNTLYAARLCVEYTNQNQRYRDSAFVMCGEPRSFMSQ